MLSNKAYCKCPFNRVPDQSLVIDNGEKYGRILAARGKDSAFFYTYNGRTFKVNKKRSPRRFSYAYWFNPKDGNKTIIFKRNYNNQKQFNPPGEKKNGNDCVRY